MRALSASAQPRVFDPFSFFKVFVMCEEMLDLVAVDLRNVCVVQDAVVKGVNFWSWNSDDFFICAAVIFHQQNATRDAFLA